MHGYSALSAMLAASFMVGLGPAGAQEAQSTTTPTEDAAPTVDAAAAAARRARTPEQAVSGFLERKKTRQQRREAVLQRRGSGGDQQELRRLYKALNIPRPNPRGQISADSQAALADSLETDAVQLLQTLSFRPARIKRLSDAGTSPLQAAAAYTRGTAGLADYALLSDIVAVVRVSGIRDEQLGDGFRSTVLLEITDSILGRAPDRPLALRQLSGMDQSGQTLTVSTDLQPSEGQTFLVMLSGGLYAQLAAEGGGQAAAPARGSARNFVALGPTYLVQGDTLTPVGLTEASATTLSQLKAAVAPVARAKNTADDTTTDQETPQ